MLKDLGSLPAGFPMPVLMVGTYNENNTPNVMNVAWGGICGMDKIALNLAADRKTLDDAAYTSIMPVTTEGSARRRSTSSHAQASPLRKAQTLTLPSFRSSR